MDDFLAYPLDKKPLPKDTDLIPLYKFRRALRREDQEVLDDLLASAKDHWPLQTLADHMTPLEFMLLTMLLEQKKEIGRLKTRLEGTS